MTKLEKALKEKFDVELEGHEKVSFNFRYCGSHVADVVVEDTKTFEIYTFPCFDMEKGCFPY